MLTESDPNRSVRDVEIVRELNDIAAETHACLAAAGDALEQVPQLISEQLHARKWTPDEWSHWCEQYRDGFTRIAQSGCIRTEKQLATLGLSVRAIASATGRSVGSVHADTAGVQRLNTTRGVDGVQQPSTKAPRLTLSRAKNPATRLRDNAYLSAVTTAELAALDYEGVDEDTRAEALTQLTAARDNLNAELKRLRALQRRTGPQVAKGG